MPIRFFPVRLSWISPIKGKQTAVTVIAAHNQISAECMARYLSPECAAWVPFWVPQDGYSSHPEAVYEIRKQGYPIRHIQKEKVNA